MLSKHHHDAWMAHDALKYTTYTYYTIKALSSPKVLTTGSHHALPKCCTVAHQPTPELRACYPEFIASIYANTPSCDAVKAMCHTAMNKVSQCLLSYTLIYCTHEHCMHHSTTCTLIKVQRDWVLGPAMSGHPHPPQLHARLKHVSLFYGKGCASGSTARTTGT